MSEYIEEKPLLEPDSVLRNCVLYKEFPAKYRDADPVDSDLYMIMQPNTKNRESDYILVPVSWFRNLSQKIFDTPSSSKLTVYSLSGKSRVVLEPSCEPDNQKPEPNQTIIQSSDAKKTQNNFERVEVSRPARVPMLSITKINNRRHNADTVSKLNQVHQSNFSAKLPDINTVACGPFTSTMRVSQEPNSQPSTSSLGVNGEYRQNGIKRIFEFKDDGRMVSTFLNCPMNKVIKKS